MIRVDRSAVPVPEVLRSERANVERARVKALLESPPEQLAQVRITFDNALYLRTREALLELFHNKCAYCETKLTAPEVQADLEHFRPKQGARAPDTNMREHLHYAWLAYEWDNLLIACGNCNRRQKTSDGRLVGKADYFPVDGSRAPLLSTVAECREKERALLIDPTFDDPAEHLRFDGESGTIAALTQKGKVTIDLLDLNRPQLVDGRLRVWKSAVFIRDAVASGVPLSDEESEALARQKEQLLSPDQEYLAVARLIFEADREPVRAAAASVEVKAETKAASPATPGRYEGREALPPLAHDRIRRIEIRNFKAIESLQFEIADPPDTAGRAGALMLLGENASGKSSVLEAVALALLGTKEISNLSLRAEDFIRRTDWSAPLSEAEPAEIRIFFESPTPISLTIDPKKKKFFGNTTPATVLLAYGPRRFFADQSALRRLAERFTRPKASARVETLFDPTIRAIKNLLGMRDEAIVKRPETKDNPEIWFEVQGVTAPLGRLSEGYKTIVATGVDIMREMLRFWPELESAAGVVLIDEIETHLHPSWKMHIMERLRSAMPQVQFITTTHDPLTLRGLFNGEVQVLARDEEFHIERLLDIPNVRGLSVEQLLTSDYFGLLSTEDQTVEETMTRYVALATKRDRTPDEDRELESHRQLAKERLVVGGTPQSRMVYEAAGEYLLQRRTLKASERPELKRESLNKLVDLWKSIDAEETPE